MPVAFDHAGIPWTWKPVYGLADFVAGIAAARVFAFMKVSDFWHNRGHWLYLPARLRRAAGSFIAPVDGGKRG